MAEAKKVLKEGTNKVTVVGTLVEKNLDFSPFTNDKGETVERIRGSISVRTGENEVHKINLKANRFTKAGGENKNYKGYVTIKDQFISVADVAEAAKNGEELKADEVRVDGKLFTNEYWQNDQFFQYQQIEGKFVNRLKEGEDGTPIANFETDIFIDKVKPEMKDDSETGRAIVSAWIPTFNAIVPYKFSVIEEGSDFFMNELQRGQTLKVYGNLLNVKKEHVKTVESAFGQPIEEISYTYVSESLINNAKVPYEEDSANAFNPEGIKERLTKREVYLEQQKSRSNSGGQQQADNRPNAFGGATTNSAPKKNDIPVDVSNLF